MSLALTYQGINSNAGRALTTKTVSSSTYTLLAADAGTLIRFTAACVVTVPANVFIASVVILCQQMGAGEVSFVGDGTLTLNVTSIYQAKVGARYGIVKVQFADALTATLLGDRALVPSLLVSAFTGAASVYSTRQVVTTQTQIWEVHRASDNATQIFGPDGSGKVDVAAIQTFLAGSQGRLRTWYDPIGNNHAVQTTTAKMPLISNASGVVLLNAAGNPTVRGNGGQIMSAPVAPLAFRSNFTIGYSSQNNLNSSQNRAFSFQFDATSATQGRTLSLSLDTSAALRYNNGSVTTNLTVAATGENSMLFVKSPGSTGRCDAADVFKNGIKATTKSTNATLLSASENFTLLYLFGGLSGSDVTLTEFYSGQDVSEVAFWRSHLTDGDIATISTALDAYH